jgi:hypothetical protein
MIDLSESLRELVGQTEKIPTEEIDSLKQKRLEYIVDLSHKVQDMMVHESDDEKAGTPEETVSMM